LQEALAADIGEPCPPLDAKVGADVCIVGGGFAGLWTAIELSAREPGLRIALLERDICGGGASGRNGGFFSSSWWDLPGLTGLFGEAEGLRYATAVSDEVAAAERWCLDHEVDAWYHREGALGIRAGAWQEGIAGEGPADVCARMGEAARMRRLTVEEARSMADSPRITAAAFVPDAAICQPARLARGLRRAALERGVRIFERTAVRGIDRGRSAVVRAETGAVRADQVVLTIGSWAASWPGFRRSFGVIADYMVVTEPIPELRREIGWTSNMGIADGRDLLYYLRPTDDDRIAIGGGATGVAFAGRAESRAVTHDRRISDAAARGLVWLFPQLEGVRFTHAWGGPIDMTPSFVPFYRTLPPGNVHAGLGFSGHGLSQTKLGGRILAGSVLGVEDEYTSLPVNAGEVAKAPPEPLRWPAIRAAVWALQSGDRQEEVGRSRGSLRSSIGSAPSRYRDRLVRRGA
jgi:glycine/D-amino acid oxidase-like deaminating enzyme